MADLEGSLLQAIDADGAIADTSVFAGQQGVDHLAVVGVMKSLQASEMITVEVRSSESIYAMPYMHVPVLAGQGQLV